MIRVADVLSATIVSAANLIVLFTNTAGANENIDDRLLLHPPNLRGREAHPGFSLPEGAQKKGKTFIFPFRTPSGARTLDPNIKSVVLYQLS